MGRRVLVIHPGALGDVLQAIPALRALGGAEAVTFCGQTRLGALLAGAAVVRESLSFDGFGLQALFTDEPAGERLRDQLARFDEVVSWFGSRDPLYTARLGEIARVRAVAPPVPAATSASTVWQHLLHTIGAGLDGARQPFCIPAAWRQEARDTLDPLGVSQSFLLVQPGAGGRSKLVAPAILARIISQVMSQVVAPRPLRIVVHQGPADHDAAGALCALLDAPTITRAGSPAVRLVDPSLASLAAVASLASAYLGGDSGVSHLAAAAGAPSVIVFPAATRRQWAPWSPSARVVAMEDEDAVESAAAILVELGRE